ncbi:OpgC domain-containing protein [Bradyrhizobium oligotrophicum]|uniref:OpgC domain-containing protein n=1 Tax=Bradyrhizobium oligotrophicum TaxID=44255 RepID=UPI003EBCFFA6
MRAATAGQTRREVLIDFYRSCSMLFVFYHHTANVFPDSVDLFTKFNPFAELFVVISGFMVGYVYLHKEHYGELVSRGLKILAAYFVISVPVAVGMAILGKKREPVGQAIFDVLTFQSEPTAITILKFYGLTFLLLPLILPLFKRNRLLVLALSASIFVACTWFANTKTSALENPAAILLLFSLQAQLFLILGTWLGDLHRRNRLLGRPFYTAMIAVFVVGLLLDGWLGFPNNGEKYPYRFDKLVNLLWTLPLLLALLWALFARTRHSAAVALVLNVGQNSLIAFLGSEVVRQSVKLALLLGGVHPAVYGQTMMGLFDVVLVTVMLWLYRTHRTPMLHPQGGR